MLPPERFVKLPPFLQVPVVWSRVFAVLVEPFERFAEVFLASFAADVQQEVIAAGWVNPLAQYRVVVLEDFVVSLAIFDGILLDDFRQFHVAECRPLR